ncbi:MAG: outer membrane beta-barrel protein [Acidobacteriota bacterium]
MNRPLLALALIAACTSFAHAQAHDTAGRLGDLQIGGGVALANSDYTQNKIRGYSFYADFDFHTHYGAELEFHQVSDPNSPVYERTYEVGGRYHLMRSARFRPYAKLMVGRGVFNSPVYSYTVPIAGCDPAVSNCVYTVVTTNFNLAYNMFAAGGGIDYAVLPRLNIRADYEYQDWLSGPGLSNGLTPQILTIGAAYHFPAGRPRFATR